VPNDEGAPKGSLTTNATATVKQHDDEVQELERAKAERLAWLILLGVAPAEVPEGFVLRMCQWEKRLDRHERLAKAARRGEPRDTGT
jgi:hypothetical protein